MHIIADRDRKGLDPEGLPSWAAMSSSGLPKAQAEWGAATGHGGDVAQGRLAVSMLLTSGCLCLARSSADTHPHDYSHWRARSWRRIRVVPGPEHLSCCKGPGTQAICCSCSGAVYAALVSHVRQVTSPKHGSSSRAGGGASPVGPLSCELDALRVAVKVNQGASVAAGVGEGGQDGQKGKALGGLEVGGMCQDHRHSCPKGLLSKAVCTSQSSWSGCKNMQGLHSMPQAVCEMPAPAGAVRSCMQAGW